MLWNNNIFVEKFMPVVNIILGAKMDQCSIGYISIITDTYIKLNYYIY